MRILHLDTGIDFQEVVVAVFVHHELHRARIGIPQEFAQLHGVSVHLPPDFLVQTKSRGRLHHLHVQTPRIMLLLATFRDPESCLCPLDELLQVHHCVIGYQATPTAADLISGALRNVHAKPGLVGYV